MPSIEPPEVQRPSTAEESAISRGIGSVYAKLYGRGPEHTRTYLEDGYALTILSETFTTAERTLLRSGQSEQVEQTRRAFQEAVRDDFIAIVEESSSRKVNAFMSQIDTDSGTAIEFFLFDDGFASSAGGNGRVEAHG